MRALADPDPRKAPNSERCVRSLALDRHVQVALDALLSPTAAAVNPRRPLLEAPVAAGGLRALPVTRPAARP